MEGWKERINKVGGAARVQYPKITGQAPGPTFRPRVHLSHVSLQIRKGKEGVTTKLGTWTMLDTRGTYGHGQRDRKFVYNNNQISLKTENLHDNLQAENLGPLAFYSSCYCYLDLGVLRDWECQDNRKLTALSSTSNVPTPKDGHVYRLIFQHTKWET